MRTCKNSSTCTKIFPFLRMIKIREISTGKFQTFDHSISLTVDRRVLAKRRWRGQAEDGTDFGFDLARFLCSMAFAFITRMKEDTS